MKKSHSDSRSALIKICKIQLLVGIALILQVIFYDASKLITPEIVMKRWIITSVFILIAGICWYLARINNSKTVIQNLAWVLVAADIALASYYVYATRGMASREVILYSLAILAIGTLHRKGAIYLTALFSVIAYLATSVAYFVINFNEGYKAELYGEIAFYSFILFAIASSTWALVKSKH